MAGLAVGVGDVTVNGGDSEQPVSECVQQLTEETLSAETAEEKSSEGVTNNNYNSMKALPYSMTGPTAMSKVVPNPSENSFSRVVLTDWFVYPGSPDNPKSEVLEFAWAVYDLSSESMLEKVRHIVRPTDHDRNTISQETLQRLKLNDARPLQHAKTLQQVMTEFDAACSMVAPPSVCVVVAAGKLRDQLLSETFRKGFSVPKCLKGVIDLATVSSHFYPSQFVGLSQQELQSPRIIATLLGATIPASPEDFPSMDGCVLMSATIKKMHSDNVNFLPQHMSTVITGPEPPTAAAPKPQPQTGPPPRPSATPPAPYSSGQEYVIKLRGVPWDATDKDIIRFIDPVCQVTAGEIHIVTNFEGRSSGEVFVRLPSMALRDQCLADLHGKHIGKRWIEVFKASEGELISFSSLKESEQLDKRVEGGFPIDVNSVVLGQSRENRLSGDAWALLDSPAVADDARRALHKKTIGKRYIELFHASPREADMARKGHSMAPGRMFQYHQYDRPSPYGGGGMSGGGGGGASWAPTSLPHHNRYGSGGPPPSYSGGGGASSSGGSSGPAVYQTPYGNHPASPSVPGGGHRGAGGGSGLGGRMGGGMAANDNKGMGVQSSVVRMRGLPYHANENHIVEFFNGFTMSAILPATAPIDGRPSGEAYVEFVSLDEAWRAWKTKQGAMMDRRYIELFTSTKQEMELAAAGMDPREIRARCSGRQ